MTRLVDAEPSAAGQPDAWSAAPSPGRLTGSRTRPPARSARRRCARCRRRPGRAPRRRRSRPGAPPPRRAAGGGSSQPPTGVDVRQTEQVAEERPVGLGVAAVEDGVRAADHGAQRRRVPPGQLGSGRMAELPTRTPPRHDRRGHRRQRQRRDGAAAPAHRRGRGGARCADWPAGGRRRSRRTPASAGSPPTSARPDSEAGARRVPGRRGRRRAPGLGAAPRPAARRAAPGERRGHPPGRPRRGGPPGCRTSCTCPRSAPTPPAAGRQPVAEDWPTTGIPSAQYSRRQVRGRAAGARVRRRAPADHGLGRPPDAGAAAGRRQRDRPLLPRPAAVRAARAVPGAVARLLPLPLPGSLAWRSCTPTTSPTRSPGSSTGGRPARSTWPPRRTWTPTGWPAPWAPVRVPVPALVLRTGAAGGLPRARAADRAGLAGHRHCGVPAAGHHPGAQLLGWAPEHRGEDVLREFVAALGRGEGHAGPLLHPGHRPRAHPGLTGRADCAVVVTDTRGHAAPDDHNGSDIPGSWVSSGGCVWWLQAVCSL